MIRPMDTARYILSLDISICHTGWALYDRNQATFDYGVIEPTGGTAQFLASMDFTLNEILNKLPGNKADWPKTVFVLGEGLSFASKGCVGAQLSGIGYFVRHGLWKLGLPFKEVAPSQGKKFLAGKQVDKNMILKEVFKRYTNPDGSPIDVDDDNIADAVNMNFIGRAMLGWFECKTEAQRAVLADLLKAPKQKPVKKQSKKKIALQPVA